MTKMSHAIGAVVAALSLNAVPAKSAIQGNAGCCMTEQEQLSFGQLLKRIEPTFSTQCRDLCDHSYTGN